MPKKKPKVELYSYGIYSPWNRSSRELPKLKKITSEIEITPDVEFGYVLKIKGAKGELLEYEIIHPPFLDEKGSVVPPFTGEVLINSNDWQFFLGDTVWEPYNDKTGEWILITRLQNKEIGRKKFTLFLPL